MQILCATVKCCRRSRDLPEKVIMTSDNIAEYVGENNQFTENPVTEYPPVIQDNIVTTKDYLYSNNIDTDLLVVIGGLIVILFLMMLIMYFINSLRHKELTEILEKISFPEKSGSNLLKPEAVSCNLLSLCVLAPVLCTPRKLAEVSREIIVASAQEIAWTPGSSRIDGHQGENITWSEVLRLTDIVTEKVSSGRAAGGYHHRHTGYTWSVSVN
ncbi:hypothetical protein D3652_13675 [Escherichia coli]|nr:hypothetical protein [Escherichia coli]EFN9173175.1 hypothetical protein [Escherichia coli]